MKCENCTYAVFKERMNGKVVTMVQCRRFPKFEPRALNDWCGEFCHLIQSKQNCVAVDYTILEKQVM